jgi:hypothetical protein
VSFGRTALLCSLIIVFASTLPVLGSPAGAANDTYIPACLNLVGTTQTLRIDGTGVPSLPKDQVTAFVAHVANERQLALPEVVVASTNSTELEFTWPGSGPLTIGVPSTAITLSERQFVQVGTVAVTIGARLNRSAAPNIAPGPEGEVERVARALDVGEGMVASIRVMQRMRGGISTSSMSGVRLALGNVRSLTVESLAEATIDLGYFTVCRAFANGGWNSVNELRGLPLTSTSQLLGTSCYRHPSPTFYRPPPRRPTVGLSSVTTALVSARFLRGSN